MRNLTDGGRQETSPARRELLVGAEPDRVRCVPAGEHALREIVPMRTDLVAGRACGRALRWRLARFLLALSIAMAPPLSAQSPAPPAPSRGALLYETHCVACHTTQVHWRDRKLATDWSSLSAQVRRWQANAGLRWTDEEIDEVVRYLNTTVYRFPEQAPKPIG